MHELAEEMGFKQVRATIIYSDNDQAVNLARTGRITPLNKYVDTKQHICVYLHQAGIIDVQWISTKSNLADVGTKSMRDVTGFETLRDAMMYNKPGTETFDTTMHRMRRTVGRDPVIPELVSDAIAVVNAAP